MSSKQSTARAVKKLTGSTCFPFIPLWYPGKVRTNPIFFEKPLQYPIGMKVEY